MTPDELRALEAEATAGPWSVDSDGCCVYADDARMNVNVAQVGVSADGTREDAALIVALRNHAEAQLGLWEAAQNVLSNPFVRSGGSSEPTDETWFCFSRLDDARARLETT